MFLKLAKKWDKSIKIIPFVFIIIFLKLGLHFYGIEGMTMNALFPSMVAAVVFLFGFLLSQCLIDFKESEKLPGEIASSLETIYDDAEIIFKSKGAPPQAEQCMKCIASMASSILAWFNNKYTTDNLFESLYELSDFIYPLEPFSTPPAISRLKTQQRIYVRRSLVQERYAIRASFLPHMQLPKHLPSSH